MKWMRMQRISFSGLLFFAVAIIFRVILDVSYVLFVNPVYEYSGFSNDLSWNSYAFSWVLFSFSITFASHRLVVVSDFFFTMALIGLIAPLTSLYGLSGRDAFPVLVSISSIGIIYILTRPRLFKTPTLPVIIEGRKSAVCVSILMVTYLVVWYWYSGAVRYFNLNFLRVYEFRDASAALANIGVLDYLNNWTYTIFSLFLLAWYLFKRNFVMVTLVFMVQVFFFGVSAHKSLLFYPLMILGLFYCFRLTDKLVVVPAFFSVLVLLVLFLYTASGQVMPASMFIRRLFYVPALLTFDYFSFFSKHEHVYWSNSVLSRFLSYPYDLSLTQLIGEYSRTGARANNGFISSGYAHAGVLGVFFYSVIFAMILRFIDMIGRYVPVWFALALVVVPIGSALLSSDLFTVMLTHGLLVALLLLILIRVPRVSGYRN